MTTVVMGRKDTPEPVMEFHFDSEMAAYGFYADAIDSYAEDDLYIEMETETDYSQYAEPVNGRDYNECLDRWE